MPDWIEGGPSCLLVRAGLVASLSTHGRNPWRSPKTAYLDGELCALRPDGVSSFSRLQAAVDEGRTEELVFFAFDLLYLEGESLTTLPLVERKEQLQRLLARDVPGLRFSEHVVGGGPRFRQEACRLALEGVISKRIDRA